MNEAHTASKRRQWLRRDRIASQRPHPRWHTIGCPVVCTCKGLRRGFKQIALVGSTSICEKRFTHRFGRRRGKTGPVLVKCQFLGLIKRDIVWRNRGTARVKQQWIVLVSQRGGMRRNFKEKTVRADFQQVA